MFFEFSEDRVHFGKLLEHGCFVTMNCLQCRFPHIELTPSQLRRFSLDLSIAFLACYGIAFARW